MAGLRPKLGHRWNTYLLPRICAPALTVQKSGTKSGLESKRNTSSGCKIGAKPRIRRRRKGRARRQNHGFLIHCAKAALRSEEHTSELQSQSNLVCRLLLEKKKNYNAYTLSEVTHTSANDLHTFISTTTAYTTSAIRLVCYLLYCFGTVSQV